MKFNINSKALLNALLHTRCVMSRNETGILPYANNYKIEVNENELKVTGTNGTMYISETIPLPEPPREGVTSDNTIVVHANFILKPLKTMGEQPLEIEFGNYQMTVNHEQGYFRVPYADCEYPSPYSIDKTEAVHVQMETPGLYSQLSKVAFATADDELRPVMCGVYVEVEPSAVNLTASDGHILMHLTSKTEATYPKTGSFIMPRNVADRSLKLLPKTGLCDMYFNDKITVMEIEGGLTIVFRNIDGRYPNYKSVLPTSCNTTFIVDRKQLLKTLNRLLIFSYASTHAVKIKGIADGTQSRLTLVTKDIDEGCLSQESISCEFTKGPLHFDKGLLLKIPFLTSILSKLTSERIVFNVVNEITAVTLTPELAFAHEDVLGLVMPMTDFDEE